MQIWYNTYAKLWGKDDHFLLIKQKINKILFFLPIFSGEMKEEEHLALALEQIAAEPEKAEEKKSKDWESEKWKEKNYLYFF